MPIHLNRYIYIYIHIHVHIYIQPQEQINITFETVVLLVFESFWKAIDQMSIRTGFSMINDAYRYQQITFSTSISTLHGQMKISKTDYFNLLLGFHIYNYAYTDMYIHTHTYRYTSAYAYTYKCLYPYTYIHAYITLRQT